MMTRQLPLVALAMSLALVGSARAQGPDIGPPQATTQAAARLVPELDERLVATDLWLVVRSADGTEQGQMLSVRGLFDRPAAFFFDALFDGEMSIDFFGHVTPRAENGTIALEVVTTHRFGPRSVPGERKQVGNLTSVLHLKPEDVVAIELPKVNGAKPGAFSARAFSLRVRSRQIRDAVGTQVPQAMVPLTSKIAVQGEVGSPGERALKNDRMTVNGAINAAGGYRPTAASAIEVRRDVTRPDGKVEKTTTRLLRENLDKGEDFALLPGDVVHVPKAPVFYVNGEVRTPACIVVWVPEMNVYKAIASCGGVTEKGKVSKSYIQRPDGKGGYVKVKNLKSETPIMRGDILIVGKGLF